MALTALSIDIMLPALPQIGAALGVTERKRQAARRHSLHGGLRGRADLFRSAFRSLRPQTRAALGSRDPYRRHARGASFRLVHDAACRADLQGIGAASARVVAVAVVRDLYSGRQMARVMSFAMMVFIVIPVLAPSLGQALIHQLAIGT